ncbi:MAG: type 1 glutamine amidotransferase domain-containing protein [Candidatus Caenarcaniphilales bacterium]|nr:type 1 glutamine amidotransferase domain-containing protein [Candidatus Caenarcaniphilales bacterium]
MSKKALIVSTSHNVLGSTGYPTGLWLPELTHPIKEFEEAGFEFDILSIKGGDIPVDPFSDPNNPDGMNTEDNLSKDFLTNKNNLLKDTKSLSEISSKDYDFILFSGGNGAIYDFPNNELVQEIILSFWQEEKFVSAICHGSAALVNVKLPNGDFLVANKQVTGFTNEEEKMAESKIGAKYVPFYLEDALIENKANFKKEAAFTPFIQRDGKLITGQQNFSGELLGKEIVKALKHNS